MGCFAPIVPFVLSCHKVERLVESVKPMYEELALFKGKIEEFQQMIRRGMDDVLAVPSAKRTSVAAFCRLSETERQLHRQAAGQRLQDVANTWELSRITEASNASRARISTVSLSGQMGRISIANLPTTAENVSDVFEPEFQEDTANQSFHSLIPRMTTSITNNVPKHFPVRDVMSGAAGDQLLISDAQDPEPRQVSGPEDTNVAAPVVFDELTDMTHAKEDPKPEVAKRKGTRSRAGCSSGARRQPRAKKTVVAAASGDNVEVSDFTEATTQRVAESSTDDEVNAGQKLRPRRKGINYRDMEEASAPTVKKKPVKRTKKTAE